LRRQHGRQIVERDWLGKMVVESLTCSTSLRPSDRMPAADVEDDCQLSNGAVQPKDASWRNDVRVTPRRPIAAA